MELECIKRPHLVGKGVLGRTRYSDHSLPFTWWNFFCPSRAVTELESGKTFCPIRLSTGLVV